MEIQEKRKILGKYRFIEYEADNSIPKEERMRRIFCGEVKPKKVSDWHKNLVVSSDGYGLNVICRMLSGDLSIPLEISELQIGTGDTAPASGDTGLETPVATGILRANQLVDNSDVTLFFFIADLDLPNGTYNELGLFCGNEGDRRLFSRSLISPEYTKNSATDSTIEYLISFSV